MWVCSLGDTVADTAFYYYILFIKVFDGKNLLPIIPFEKAMMFFCRRWVFKIPLRIAL
jgi:hypothetical protein